MAEFKEWLLLEVGRKIEISIPANLPTIPLMIKAGGPGGRVVKEATPVEFLEIIRKILQNYFQRIDPRGYRFAKNRYAFIITKVTDEHSELTIDVDIKALHGKRGSEEISQTGDVMHDYYQRNKHGKTGRTNYKSPKDAIKEIPDDPAYAYRGMAWEEWQNIRRTGYLKSHGHWNLGSEQENYTLFGKTPSTGLSYANSFAPLQYKTSYYRPSVVVAIPRKLTLSHNDAPDAIPESELGIKGVLSKEKIIHAWMSIPTQSEVGNVKFIIDYTPAWDSNKYKDPMTGFYKLDTEHFRIGSGNLSTISRYAIRQMF